jgi:multiple sugar transport system substrate-binding protein
MDVRRLPGRYSRRTALRVGGGVAAVLLGPLLSACGSAPPPTASSAAPPKADGAAGPAPAKAAEAPGGAQTTTVLFVTNGTGDGAYTKVVDLFMAKNPAIKIKHDAAPSDNFKYYERLQTDIAGGVKPDLATFQGWEFQPYADKGLLADLDPLIGRDKFTSPWPNLEAVKTHTEWRDKKYLIPTQIASMLMLYARKPFEEKGIKPPTDDWTFEQFLDLAQKLTDTSGPSKKFGYEANGNWYRDIHWMRGNGEDEFDRIVEPRKAQFSSPGITEIVQLVVSDVYRKMKVSPTPSDLQGGANTIASGSTAMKYEGPWFFRELNSPKLREQNKGVAFDAVMMPKMKDGRRRHRAWSQGICLLSGPRVEQTWTFAKYLTGDEEGQKAFAEISGTIPNTLELAEKFWVPKVKENFGIENGRAFLTVFNKDAVPDVIGLVPRSRMWLEAVKPLGWDPLVAGSAQAKDVLPKVDAKLQEMLDEYWKTRG